MIRDILFAIGIPFLIFGIFFILSFAASIFRPAPPQPDYKRIKEIDRELGFDPFPHELPKQTKKERVW